MFQLVRRLNKGQWEQVGDPLEKKDLEELIGSYLMRCMVPHGTPYKEGYPSFIGKDFEQDITIEVSFYELETNQGV